MALRFIVLKFLVVYIYFISSFHPVYQYTFLLLNDRQRNRTSAFMGYYSILFVCSFGFDNTSSVSEATSPSDDHLFGETLSTAIGPVVTPSEGKEAPDK